MKLRNDILGAGIIAALMLLFLVCTIFTDAEIVRYKQQIATPSLSELQIAYQNGYSAGIRATCEVKRVNGKPK